MHNTPHFYNDSQEKSIYTAIWYDNDDVDYDSSYFYLRQSELK